jgi:hypothetical protein
MEPLDRARHRAANVDEREDLGPGETLAQRVENFFASAHPGEPVVNEGDAEGSWLLA